MSVRPPRPLPEVLRVAWCPRCGARSLADPEELEHLGGCLASGQVEIYVRGDIALRRI